MDESILLRIALVCGVAGVIGLYFVSENTGITEISISKINNENIGSTVVVIGTVQKVADFEKTMIIDVSDENGKLVSVLLFKDGKIKINEGNKIKITGTVEEYKGKMELIGEEVKVVG